MCTPVTCIAEDGKVYSGGDQWEDDDGLTCTCSAEGIDCVCGPIDCPGGTTKWTEPGTCISKCIPRKQMAAKCWIKLGTSEKL